MLKSFCLRVLPVVALVLLLAYIGDYLSIAFRIPHNRAQFGSVQVQRYFAVKLKDHKTEYMFQAPEAESCVNSLFPQLGSTPCWYLKRHPTEEMDY